MAQDGAAFPRDLDGPWKKEREVQTMDPDDLIRNEQGKLRRRDVATKPTSRDVEDMRRYERRDERYSTLERRREKKASEIEDESFDNNNRISGVKARVGEIREG